MDIQAFYLIPNVYAYTNYTWVPNIKVAYGVNLLDTCFPLYYFYSTTQLMWSIYCLAGGGDIRFREKHRKLVYKHVRASQIVGL